MSVTKATQSFHRHTPLIYSHALSTLTNKSIYLKLDALQASGSFKDRGVGHLLTHSVQEEGINYVLCSSGGNAGLSAATVSRQMGLQCHVIVPHSTTEIAINKIKNQNAHVTVTGSHWKEADEHARALLHDMNSDPTRGQKAVFVHPFDHKLLWEGHSTMVDELAMDFHAMRSDAANPDHLQYFLSPDNHHCPSAIICSVGGGGFLKGLCRGLQRHAWNEHVTVVTAETYGTDSFYQSFMKGELVTLDAITSIATSLGAPTVQRELLQDVHNKAYCKQCVPVRVTDVDCVNAVLSFLHDHRLLVEPACAASLALLYNEQYVKEVLHPFDSIVVQICGGSGVDYDVLTKYVMKAYA